MKRKLSINTRRKSSNNTSKMKVEMKPSPTMKIVGQYMSALAIGNHCNNHVRGAPKELFSSKYGKVLVVILVLETSGGTNSKTSMECLGRNKSCARMPFKP
jgi:hypothetical protein